MLHFLLFAVVALTGAAEQGNLQYGELAFTETQSQGVNATRMTLVFSISAFQNLTVNDSQSATLAMNQVMEVITQVKQALGQFNSIAQLTTTQLNLVEQNCNESSHCPPGPNLNLLNGNNMNTTAAPTTPPTTPPVNGTAEPIINGTTPPIVNGTTPPINGTTAPLNGTAAPIINGTTAPVVNGTSAPINGTVPAVNGTVPPINGTTAPFINGTTAPVTTPPVISNNSIGNATWESGWGYLASMQLTFEANLTEGQQVILQTLQAGGPWISLSRVSFGAADDDLQTARSNATDLCLSGLRRQAEDMMNNLQVCFVNWKKIWISDLSDTTPIVFPGLVDRFVNWNSQQQQQSQELIPSSPGLQSVKMSISAIARFQDCANNNNNTSSSSTGTASSSTGSSSFTSSISSFTGSATGSASSGGVSASASGGTQ